MSIASALYGDVDMAKLMLGNRAFHIPLNMIVQSCGEADKVAGVFQTSMGSPLLLGSQRTNILLLGDMYYRPRLAIGSDEFRGRGIGGLYKDGFIDMDTWRRGDVILPPLDGDMPKPR